MVSKKLKIILAVVWIVGSLALVASGSLNRLFGSRVNGSVQAAVSDDYMGSDSCRDCHEDQFKAFALTKHAKLGQLADWKGKAHGCESCHGPGKAHIEGEGDKTKIISFKNKSSKAVSETCLTCHAGKEDHNNFRRGEHWRNDVGCTDCHSSHDTKENATKAGSITYPEATSRFKPDRSTVALLRTGEPQLCLSCHKEQRVQFTKPFHHKVLEGQMKCSDCHNAHGGFESKQTRLAQGGDAPCIKCHADKQGPFVYEHLPLKSDGCQSCHSSHGSNNPKMLVRKTVNQLCLECHSGITVDLAPDATHNITSTRYQDCTICHRAIHGSNAHQRFFR